ncbi:hypothetical protein L1987_45158 [Smallanthus sonchifolius]|uniref:Uncharacterized protein n=1 Tax=Smallanthus sonchifolius TaxID=185202 RepID=A0ACB9GSI6_9ASTR|nr:hypothetical protein L1987_45158 [Smallanthus sonchifolius]
MASQEASFDAQANADQSQVFQTPTNLNNRFDLTFFARGWQLHRDAQQPAQNAGVIEQTENSVKTMAHGAAVMAGGAASGVMGIAQGAAMGAANLAEGAAGAVKNTFGSNQGS